MRLVEGENVFAAFSSLAAKHSAVNLGQGFPSFPPPSFLTEAAARSFSEPLANQYTRPGGNPELVRVLAEFYSPLLGRKLDAETEICTTNAQQSIFLAMRALCEPGDEVVLVEPFFDAYYKAALLSDLTAVGVPLRNADGSDAPPTSTTDYVLDCAELERSLTPRSRLLVLNTPHNPSGKVFSRDELEAIAAVVRRHPRLLVLSDEVYEFAVFDGKHERFSSIEGMWERTVSMHSAGKTFSATGWRVGYSIAPAHLTLPMIKAQAIVSFAGSTPLELAVAEAIREGQSQGYFETYPKVLARKRDLLVRGLRELGLRPVQPEGGYFTLVAGLRQYTNVSGGESVAADASLDSRPDFRTAEALTEHAGVTGIPPSAFYFPHNRHLADELVRFAICKEDDEIADALRRLERFIETVSQ